MLKWIEQAGGQTSAAAAIAPVIRSLSLNDFYPIVRFKAHLQEETCEDTANKTDVLCLDTSGTAEVSDLCTQLQAKLTPDIR